MNNGLPYGYNSFFPTKLRKLMDEKNITQDKLAKVNGTTRQTISNYVLGTVQPNLEKIVSIANYFEVSTDYLLTDTEIRTKDESIQSACKYVGLSESALSELHDFTHEETNEFYSDLLSDLIEKTNGGEEGFILRISRLLGKSLISSYQFDLLYNDKDKNNENISNDLLLASDEFEFNKLIIEMYQNAHIELLRTHYERIKEITSNNIDDIIETAKITKQKMEDILENLVSKNAYADILADDAERVRKQIQQQQLS